MSEPKAESRPHCAACGVDMWLASIVRTRSGADVYAFECKACGAQVTLSPDPEGARDIEAGL